MNPIIEIYLDPRGRTSRGAYWKLYFVPLVLICVVAGVVDAALSLGGTVVIVTAAVIFWPWLVSQIRRWRDLGFSGVFGLLSLVPYIGVLISLLIGLFPGQEGDMNRHGFCRHLEAIHSGTSGGVHERQAVHGRVQD